MMHGPINIRATKKVRCNITKGRFSGHRMSQKKDVINKKTKVRAAVHNFEI